MRRRHLPWQRIVAELEQSPLSRELASELLDHLTGGCPECDRKRRNDLGRVYGLAFERALAGAHSRSALAGELRQVAEREFAALERLRASERTEKVRRSIKRYRNPILVDLCLAASRALVRERPFAALAWAETAREVALRLPHSQFGSALCLTCLARANAWRGNALRATGRLSGAEPLLAGAFQLFSRDGTGDLIVLGELASLLASLRRDQRRFKEAQRYLDMAIASYRQLGEHRLLASALVQEGNLAKDAGHPQRALAAVDEALALIEPDEEPHLHLAALNNRAHYLADLGRYEEARELLAAVEPLHLRHPASRWQLRSIWLQGKISHGLGQLADAERDFREVRQRLVADGHDYDAALAGLDLALVLVEEGRTTELKQLAAELVPVFQAERIEREALASLLLFHQAVLQEVATVSMATELCSRIRRLPARPPEQPS